MKASAIRLSLRAAGLAVITAVAVSSCAAATITPLAAVELAAKTTGKVDSFAATLSIHITVKPGAVASTALSDTQMTGTVAEQLHPTLLVRADIGSLTSAGTSLPGGLSEIITPTTMYLKWSYFTQQLQLTKPWLVIPLSTFNKLGVNFSQIMNQATSNGLLADSQLLADATSVHRVGTSSINGVPVTEYTGTIPLSTALSHLSGSLKTEVKQLETAQGIAAQQFTIWVDGNNIVRKEAITMAGTGLTESVVMTVTSINQPATVTLPPASQTSQLPSGALG